MDVISIVQYSICSQELLNYIYKDFSKISIFASKKLGLKKSGYSFIFYSRYYERNLMLRFSIGHEKLEIDIR